MEGEGETFQQWFASLSVERKAEMARKWLPDDGKDPDVAWFLKQQVRIAHEVMLGTLHPGIFDLLAPTNKNVLEALKLMAPGKGGPMVQVNNVQLPARPPPLQIEESWDMPQPLAIEDRLRSRREPA